MSASHIDKIRTKKTNKILLSIVYFVSFVEPLTTIPQLYSIWINKQTAGVSILTWSGFLLAALVWLIYGINQKDKALIISGSLWTITESLIILGLLIN